MKPEAAVVYTLQILEELKIPYMVVGSFSSNQYGPSRSTKNADLVIQHSSDTFRELIRRLEPEIKVDRQISFESVTGTARNIATVVKTGFQIEFFRLSKDSHDLRRFERRKKIHFEGSSIWMQTVEDVVITKLRWILNADRPRDLADVREVLSASRDVIDWDYVNQWTDQHGTSDLLASIQTTLPAELQPDRD